MNVYVIDDFGYKTWIAANNAREAINFYQKVVIGKNIGFTVDDAVKLHIDDVKTELVKTNEAEYKTFAELLTENDSKSPWVIVSER